MFFFFFIIWTVFFLFLFSSDYPKASHSLMILKPNSFQSLKLTSLIFAFFSIQHESRSFKHILFLPAWSYALSSWMNRTSMFLPVPSYFHHHSYNRSDNSLSAIVPITVACTFAWLEDTFWRTENDFTLFWWGITAKPFGLTGAL